MSTPRIERDWGLTCATSSERGFTQNVMVPVVVLCEHDYDFLECIYDDAKPVRNVCGHRFYCRKCLEYREVER